MTYIIVVRFGTELRRTHKKGALLHERIATIVIGLLLVSTTITM